MGCRACTSWPYGCQLLARAGAAQRAAPAWQPPALQPRVPYLAGPPRRHAELPLLAWLRSHTHWCMMQRLPECMPLE